MTSINRSDTDRVHSGSLPQRTASDTEISSSLELKIFLLEWVAGKGRRDDYLGDTQPIEELVRLLDINQCDRLLSHLERAYTMCEVARTHPDSREASFGFLPPTLSTYLVNDILLRSPEVRDRSNARLQGQNGAELLRYKIRVVRDSFLWLSDLVERRSDWVDLIVSETHTMTQDLVGARLIWLSGTQTREFCERPTTANVITEDGRSALENLWQMFDGNEEAPIRIAFSLAKLDAKGRWSDAWGRLNEVNRLLW